MSDHQAQAKFLTGNLTAHTLKMSATSAIGFVALFVVDLVDMIFISMLGIAELAAAVGFAGTILFITTSVGIGMGIAGGALVASALGADRPDRARELLTHSLIVGVLIGAGFAALIYQNLGFLTGLVGAVGETQALAVSYLKILTPSMPVLMIGIIASAALRSHGAAKLSMVVTLTGGVVNAILDPIFIFALDMGLDGAAWASVISRIAIAFTGMWYILRQFGGMAGLSMKALSLDLRPIAAIAVPAILANVAAPVGGAYVTRAAAEFGEAAVAGMAIIGRVTPIAFAMIFAMSGAIGPIIGQNFGARKHARVRQAYNGAMVLIVVYTVPVVLVLYLLRGPIADLFNAQGIARDLIFLFCGPLSLAWIFNGMIFISNAAFNNLGKPFYSTWVNWGRNTFGIIPFVYIGAATLGAEGVLVGQMAGGIFVAILSLGLAHRLMRQAENAQIPVLREPAFAPYIREFKIANHRQ